MFNRLFTIFCVSHFYRAMDKWFIYWIDKYVGGYRKGVSHASNDGDETACGRKIGMEWDGGYNSIEVNEVECKKCKRALANCG